MRHLRDDYNAIQPWPVKRPHHAKIDGELRMNTGYLPDGGYDPQHEPQPIIPDDEPVFLIRGQDPIGGQTVRAYADYAERCGADPAMVQAIYVWADRMEEYAESKQHGAPDVPKGLLRDPRE